MVDELISRELVGVVVGGLIGFVSAMGRDWWQERQQKRRVRLLLRLELSDNLVELGRYWGDVSRKSGENIAEHVAATPLPSWSDAAWRAQLALVPIALDESEIAATQRHYSGLEKLKGRRQQLVNLAAEDAADRRAGEQAEGAAAGGFGGRHSPHRSMLSHSRRFADAAPSLSREITTVVGDLQAVGNPLVGSKPRSRGRFWKKGGASAG